MEGSREESRQIRSGSSLPLSPPLSAAAAHAREAPRMRLLEPSGCEAVQALSDLARIACRPLQVNPGLGRIL